MRNFITMTFVVLWVSSFAGAHNVYECAHVMNGWRLYFAISPAKYRLSLQIDNDSINFNSVIAKKSVRGTDVQGWNRKYSVISFSIPEDDSSFILEVTVNITSFLMVCRGSTVVP